jgi:hypothetical protein
VKLKWLHRSIVVEISGRYYENVVRGHFDTDLLYVAAPPFGLRAPPCHHCWTNNKRKLETQENEINF